jgi:hypothetical protein
MTASNKTGMNAVTETAPVTAAEIATEIANGGIAPKIDPNATKTPMTMIA